MPMVNLKSDPQERKDSTLCCPSYEEPAYPYGLQIHLCDEVLKKLGMGILPKAGVEVTFTAKAMVTNVSQHEEAGKDDSKVERNVTLQITDMDLGQGRGKSQAERLYGS